MKKSPPLSKQPPSKNWHPVKPTPPPLFENLVEGSTLLPVERGGGGGVHTMMLFLLWEGYKCFVTTIKLGYQMLFLGDDKTQTTPSDTSFELPMRVSVSQKPCLLHYHTFQFHCSSVPSSISITFPSPNWSWYVWYCLTLGICIELYFLPHLYSK